MDDAELDALVRFQHKLLTELATDQVLEAKDLCKWHKSWLGDIYVWAGQYRSVNMQNDDFLFAAANFIPKLMNDFERDFLSKYTPCEGMNHEKLAKAIAVCHIEFIVIHPFREGNGRLGRLLATVMALQANQPLLNFQLLEDEQIRYIAAIHAGHAGDDQPMTLLFKDVIEYTRRAIEGK